VRWCTCFGQRQGGKLTSVGGPRWRAVDRRAPRWQARVEAGSAGEVVSEHHRVTMELGDMEVASDSGWTRLASRRCSVVHDA
jgi:hypothetical protein